MFKRFAAAVCLAFSFAGAFAVMGPGVPWCAADWVQSNSYLSWFFNCHASAGGGSSGAQ